MEQKQTPKQQAFEAAIKAAENLAGAVLQQASNRLIAHYKDQNLETDIQVAAMCISFVKNLTNAYEPPAPIAAPPSINDYVKRS